ncbi:MAG: TonB-dependent receptor [Bacteroidota bacterium]
MKSFSSIIRILSLLTMISFFPGLLLAADNGVIKGVVNDAVTGEGLPGANVVIKSIYHGTATDYNGEFILTNVPEGTVTLTVSYLGYRDKEVVVEMAANETKTIEVILEVLAIQGEEAVVTAQAYGQRAAINQQLAANTVTNVVSSEKIEELPDANAAEAIGRLPGISLKRNAGEASQVVIRGLSPKYNNVTIEGIKMASTSDYDRSVDLSLIQSESLGGIEVSKSLRPDMDADALGGTINLRLAKAPNKRKIDLTAEGGYANISQEFANYKFTGGISDRFFDKKLGINLKLSHEQKQMPSHQFGAGYYGPYTNTILDGEGEVVDTILDLQTTSMTLVERQQTRRRTNGALILDFQNDWWEVKFFNLFSQKNDDVTSRNSQYMFDPSTVSNFRADFSENFWKARTRTHTLQNSFRFGKSKLDLDLSTTYADIGADGQSFPFIEDNKVHLDKNWLVYRQPKEALDMVGGPDSLSIPDTYLEMLSMGDQSLIDESYDVRFDYELTFTMLNVVSGKLQLGGKFHQLTRTSEASSRYYDFRWGGGVVRRQSFANYFDWLTLHEQAIAGFTGSNFIDNTYDPGEFLNGRYELGWSADIDLLTDMQDEWYQGEDETRYFIRGVQSYERDYQASERLFAGYIMTELNIGQRLMLLPGVRYERNETEYFAYHIETSSGASGIQPNPDSITTNRLNARLFPSVNMKFKLTESASLQGAVYRSTSRPSFRQISPLVIYPNTGNYLRSNNPFLEPSSAWNYDLGFTISKPKIGLFTIYGFYKRIEDLSFVMRAFEPNKMDKIVGGPDDLKDRLLGSEYYEQVYLDRNVRTDLPFNNTELAEVMGLEVSWQTNFWYLPGVLKGLVLDINFTLLDSRTKYAYFESVVVDVDSSGFIPRPITGQEYTTRSGPMEDQPEAIWNIILGWDHKGFSGRISYRYQSKTVEWLDAKYSVFDSYYDPFSLLDIMLKQKITDRISCYANLTNVGNHIDDYYFGKQEELNRPALPTNSQYYGFRAQVGVKVSL